MVSNFPRIFVAPDEFIPHSAEIPQTEGLGERVFDRVREAFCGLSGHDNLLQFQQERMFLKCVSCGHESPGWDLNEARPTALAQVDTPPATVRSSSVVRGAMLKRRIA